MESNNTIKVFRYDNYYDSIKEVEVDCQAPLDYWLPAVMGDGEYIYTKTEKNATGYRREWLESELNKIKEKLRSMD